MEGSYVNKVDFLHWQIYMQWIHTTNLWIIEANEPLNLKKCVTIELDFIVYYYIYVSNLHFFKEYIQCKYSQWLLRLFHTNKLSWLQVSLIVACWKVFKELINIVQWRTSERFFENFSIVKSMLMKRQPTKVVFKCHDL